MTSICKQHLPVSLPTLTHTGVDYFDYSATTFMPERVMNVWKQVNKECGVFIGRGSSILTKRAVHTLECAEQCFHEFFRLSSEYEFLYAKNVTEGINLLAMSLSGHLRPLDMIVVGPYEHHSNYLPWRALAQRTGALFCELPLDAQGYPDYSYFERFRDRIRIVSVSAVSNSFGFRLDLSRICGLVGKNTLLFVDHSQVSAHEQIFVDPHIGAHFLSSHKMYGPKNIALTAIQHELLSEIEPVLLGGGMVDIVGYELVWSHGRTKFMAGTMDTALIAAWAEACRFIADITYQVIHEQDMHIHDMVWNTLSRLGWEIIGPDMPCASHILSFVHPRFHAHDVNDFLAQEKNMIIRSGHLCSQNALRKLGQGAINRISFGVGVTDESVKRLCNALEEMAYV